MGVTGSHIHSPKPSKDAPKFMNPDHFSALHGQGRAWQTYFVPPDQEYQASQYVRRLLGELTCPHCGGSDCVETRNQPQAPFYCPDCHGRFSVTTGTYLHRNRVRLGLWITAVVMRGIAPSLRYLGEDLGLSYKTTWRMAKCIDAAVVRVPRTQDAKPSAVLKLLLSPDPKRHTRNHT